MDALGGGLSGAAGPIQSTLSPAVFLTLIRSLAMVLPGSDVNGKWVPLFGNAYFKPFSQSH